MDSRMRSSIVALLLTLASASTEAARSIRVEFGEDWGPGLSLDACPGSSSASMFVTLAGSNITYTFSGQSDPNFNFDTDTYCQVTTPFNPGDPGATYFSQFSIPTDEPGLRAMIGSNRDNRARAIRYSFLSGPRFNNPNGFQWAFYTFRERIIVVGLYGLTGIPLTSAHSFIAPGIWDGGVEGYDDRYFCFRRSEAAPGGTLESIGSWNGNLSVVGNTCLQEVATLFRDGLE